MNDELEVHVYIVQAALVKLFTRYLKQGHLTIEEKENALKFMVEIGKSFLRKTSNGIDRRHIHDVIDDNQDVRRGLC